MLTEFYCSCFFPFCPFSFFLNVPATLHWPSVSLNLCLGRKNRWFLITHTCVEKAVLQIQTHFARANSATKQTKGLNNKANQGIAQSNPSYLDLDTKPSEDQLQSHVSNPPANCLPAFSVAHAVLLPLSFSIVYSVLSHLLFAPKYCAILTSTARCCQFSEPIPLNTMPSIHT